MTCIMSWQWDYEFEQYCAPTYLAGVEIFYWISEIVDLLMVLDEASGDHKS